MLFGVLLGNPGVANFYEEFMLMLHEKSGCRLPIWCVSHAGQVTLPDDVAEKSEYTPGSKPYLLHSILHHPFFVTSHSVQTF